MKRSGFKPREKPLARSKPMKASSKPIRSTRPKMTPIRRAARGQPCEINLVGVCTHDPLTTVWCHSNSYAHGKGAGLKAEDQYGAVGCFMCHGVYDGQIKRPEGMTKEYVDERFAIAMERSRVMLRRKGLLA